MKVLLDENIDMRFKHSFDGPFHEAFTVRDMNWQGVKNGKLSTLAMHIIIIDVHSNVLPSLKKNFKAHLICWPINWIGRCT